ncbi:MAG: class I SAM-dependent methyltransferase [Pleurocapsa sp. SU_5_0]|nr:class I SAM-dependent methyltransferase [Pleurocapsa sp. SU_5_0]NJO94723.1 class I SAM-dependent methyltransferase [Pleurocapsa sp. CRU_1_2]NJR45836.1 class I SAM-dependent methyltransferase [Hyellaceae cyanobacterium CSU_1_1]
MTDNQLYQMNPQERFSDRAQDYAKYRPSYPSEAINCILEQLGESSSLIAADIGAGTGISSRLLADRGVKVIAIEPNVAMRQVAQKHPLVEFRDGSAENTKLPDKSVDLVTCFQSFHWFNPKPTLTEFARILQPEGRIALVWNDRDLDGGDRFTREHDYIITQASNNSPIHSRLDGKSGTFIKSLFPLVSQHIFSSQQAFTKDSLIGLAMSASYIPQEGKVHQQLLQDLANLHQKYCDEQSLVYLKYKTSVYLASLLVK